MAKLMANAPALASTVQCKLAETRREKAGIRSVTVKSVAAMWLMLMLLQLPNKALCSAWMDLGCGGWNKRDKS